MAFKPIVAFSSVVILFLGACMVPPHLSMVTEYMEMGSLYYLIHMSGQKKRLSWRRRLKIIRDICRLAPSLYMINDTLCISISVIYFPRHF
jgi:serine/threonine protein kinase